MGDRAVVQHGAGFSQCPPDSRGAMRKSPQANMIVARLPCKVSVIGFNGMVEQMSNKRLRHRFRIYIIR